MATRRTFLKTSAAALAASALRPLSAWQGANDRIRMAVIEAKMFVNPRGGVEEDYPLDAHARNFLDCVKSRQKPNAHMEIGYHSALPALLALESLQQGRALGWDAAARKSKAL
jgi:hypothetical protein